MDPLNIAILFDLNFITKRFVESKTGNSLRRVQSGEVEM
jgi:hypothetical protein